MKHDTFIFKKSWFTAVEDLDTETQLEVLKSIIRYGTDQPFETEEMTPFTQGIFKIIQADMDEMRIKYDRICAMRSEIGRKGIIDRWQKVKDSKNSKCYQEVANATKSNQLEANDSKCSNNITQSNNIDIEENIDNKENIISDISYRTTTRTHAHARKKEETPVEERRKNFGLSLEPYLGQYSRKMLSRFYDHWGELSKDGKKMRWELEKTWELDRRLSKWASNEKFEPTAQSPEPEARIDKIEDAGEGAREILRQVYQQQTNVPQLNN